MEHIEEHILELYSLRSKKIEGRRQEIEAHLRQCAGCRALVEEMTSFYRELQEETERRRGLEQSRDKNLVLSGPRIPVVSRPDAYRIAHTPPGLIQRARLQISDHPLASAFGAFAFGAAALAGILQLASGPPEDANPAYAFQSVDQNLVQIRNRDHHKLWDFPSFELSQQAATENARRIRTTVVADLHGDGRNEVVSVLKMGSERESLSLRVFDNRQRLMFSRDFVQEFQYRDRSYTPRFCPTAIVTLPAVGGKEREIFVAVHNLSRSPSYIARFNAEGEELGQYWHFGHIQGLYEVTLAPGGPAQLMLIGLNDTGDTSEAGRRTSFPFAALLDPRKITGRKRSVTAPGYVMPASDAEEYYIRFPQSSSDSALAQVTGVLSMSPRDEGTLVFNLESVEPYEGLRAQFEYTFDPGLRVVEVKTSDLTQTLFGRLLAEGRLTGKPDPAYLAYLKNSVRYWDGQRWTPDPVRISHPPQLSAAQ